MKGAAAFLRSVAGWRAMLGLLALLGPLAPGALDAAQEEFPERQVTQGPYSKFLQDISPDGNTFYYVSYCLTTDDADCVLAIPAAGGQPREIAPYRDLTRGTSTATLSPDGAWILVDFGNSLKKYPTVAGDPVVLQDGKSNRDVSWSPDGGSVLFREQLQGPNDPVPYQMLYRVPADWSGTLSPLLTEYLYGYAEAPTWRSDGFVYFTYCSQGQVTCRIGRVPADGSGTLAYLTPQDAYYRRGGFSPDGSMITATVKRPCGDVSQLAFVVLELGSLRELEAICSAGRLGPWHRSSRGYFFVDGVTADVLRYRPLGGSYGSTPVKAARVQVMLNGPDGRWLAYTRRDAAGILQIYVLDISALLAEVPALAGGPSAASVAGLLGLALLRGATLHAAGGR